MILQRQAELSSHNALPPLRVDDLHIDYRVNGQIFAAVQGVSFDVNAGEVVALVGESGSGKSTIALSALGMLPPTATISRGTVLTGGQPLNEMRENAVNHLRGSQVGLIPQDPLRALNPLQRIGKQVAEPLIIHRVTDKRNLINKVISLLKRVHIPQPEIRIKQYPHELSGGMRQRILIASTLGPEPNLIIADEPTTALDVTVQKAILDDIDELIKATGAAMLLITHDLGVAADRADRIIVLQGGKVVEQGNTQQILTAPQHIYTQQLLNNAPGLTKKRSMTPPLHGSDEQFETSSLLSIRNISHSFYSQTAQQVPAVSDVSLEIPRGKTLALVGESGSGKSTSARIALGLIRPERGSVWFEGQDIRTFDKSAQRRMRRLVQPIYQNPFSSFDPRFTVAEIIAEPLIGFGLGTQTKRRQRVMDLAEQVNLAPHLLSRYPSELSGGQLQRVAIARALAPEPTLLICDEPVSALDVTVQAQILDLLSHLQEKHGLSYLFITHDLAVVRQVADRIVVMKEGRVVESGSTDTVFTDPLHAYTRLLLASIPGQSARKI